MAAFEKNAVKLLSAGKVAFANMLTDKNRSTDLLEAANINRGDSYTNKLRKKRL